MNRERLNVNEFFTATFRALASIESALISTHRAGAHMACFNHLLENTVFLGEFLPWRLTNIPINYYSPRFFNSSLPTVVVITTP